MQSAVARVYAAWGIEHLLRPLALPRRGFEALPSYWHHLSPAAECGAPFCAYTPRGGLRQPSRRRRRRDWRYMVRAFTPNPSARSGRDQRVRARSTSLGLRGFYWKPGSLALLLRGFPGCGCGARRAAHHGDATGAVSSWSPERAEQMATSVLSGLVASGWNSADPTIACWRGSTTGQVPP